MKNHFLTVILAFTTAATLSANAAPPANTEANSGQTKTTPTEKPAPKSTFDIPAKPQDGRDPFFPASDRLYAIKSTPKQAPSSNSSALVFNGKNGSPDHPLVMINGKTFAEGEEGPVNTSGVRVRLRCLEIKGDIVVIEVAGERRELHFQDR
jgi:hypothetical protein